LSTNPANGIELLSAGDVRDAARRAADWIAARAREAVAERGIFSLAISGGKTHWLMLAMLASDENMPWAETELFQVDERLASPGSPERNLTHLILTLPIEKQSALRPMPVTRRDLEEATREYDHDLPERLDVVHLGLEADGGMASIAPGSEALTIEDRRVIITTPPGSEYRCMTLTLAAINQARAVAWLVTGGDKSEALQQLIDGDGDTPACQVQRENACIAADSTALGAGSESRPGGDWQDRPS
jgi:6-phosphogluconolactonase